MGKSFRNGDKHSSKWEHARKNSKNRNKNFNKKSKGFKKSDKIDDVDFLLSDLADPT